MANLNSLKKTRESYAMTKKLKFKKFGEINFEKMEKFCHDFTKTFGEINFEKTEK